jgi:hypothetical protein
MQRVTSNLSLGTDLTLKNEVYFNVGFAARYVTNKVVCLILY